MFWTTNKMRWSYISSCFSRFEWLKAHQGTFSFFFCVDENYWVFDAERQIRGPESIRTLGLSVSGIQAAMRWGHDSTYDTYFFKSGSYWRFSPHQNRVESAYPRSMQDWSGIPNDVDASFRDVYGTKQHILFNHHTISAGSAGSAGLHDWVPVNFSCSSFRLRPLYPRTTVLEIRPSRHELSGGLSSLRRHGFFWLQKCVS